MGILLSLTLETTGFQLQWLVRILVRRIFEMAKSHQFCPSD